MHISQQIFTVLHKMMTMIYKMVPFHSVTNWWKIMPMIYQTVPLHSVSILGKNDDYDQMVSLHSAPICGINDAYDLSNGSISFSLNL